MSGVDELADAIRAVERERGRLPAGRLAEELHARGVRAATPLDDLDVPDWLQHDPLPDPGVFVCSDDLFHVGGVDVDFEISPFCVLPAKHALHGQLVHEGPCWYACDVDPSTFHPWPANLAQLVRDAVLTEQDAEKAAGAGQLLSDVSLYSVGPDVDALPGASVALTDETGRKIGTVTDMTKNAQGVRITATLDDGTLLAGDVLPGWRVEGTLPDERDDRPVS